MDVEIENGKYTLRVGNDGSLSCLRNGSPWICESRVLEGGKMLIAMAHDLNDARAEVARLAVLLKKAAETSAGFRGVLEHRSKRIDEQAAMIESLERTVLHTAIAYGAEVERLTVEQYRLLSLWSVQSVDDKGGE